MFDHIFVVDIFSLDFKEKEKDKSKVCFLSGVERKVLSGGYSRLDCEYSRERRDVGPGSYKTERITSALHQTLNKVGIVFMYLIKVGNNVSPFIFFIGYCILYLQYNPIKSR